MSGTSFTLNNISLRVIHTFEYAEYVRVYLCSLANNPSVRYILKEYPSELLEHARRERDILLNHPHPYMIKIVFYEEQLRRNTIRLLTESPSYRFIDMNFTNTTDVAYETALETALIQGLECLEHIHAKGYVYRGIYPENVCATDNHLLFMHFENVCDVRASECVRIPALTSKQLSFSPPDEFVCFASDLFAFAAFLFKYTILPYTSERNNTVFVETLYKTEVQGRVFPNSSRTKAIEYEYVKHLIEQAKQQKNVLGKDKHTHTLAVITNLLHPDYSERYSAAECIRILKEGVYPDQLRTASNSCSPEFMFPSPTRKYAHARMNALFSRSPSPSASDSEDISPLLRRRQSRYNEYPSVPTRFTRETGSVRTKKDAEKKKMEENIRLAAEKRKAARKEEERVHAEKVDKIQHIKHQLTAELDNIANKKYGTPSKPVNRDALTFEDVVGIIVKNWYTYDKEIAVKVKKETEPRKIYRVLSRFIHPDKNRGESVSVERQALAEEFFTLLNNVNVKR